GCVAYAASKAALGSLLPGLAAGLRADGIVLNALCPGRTDTPQLRGHTDDRAMASAAAEHPLGRLGTAEEMAIACRFLLRGDHGLVGQELRVTGGVDLC